jgi:hypothetical protein
MRIYPKALHSGTQRLFALLLLLWFAINFIQAAFTEVIADEAYYYFYSVNMAWGYFDHPPLVALLIKISSQFFNGSLSIRFMTVLLQVFTLLLIWKTLAQPKASKHDVWAFFGTSAAIVMFVVYGFIATPDPGLLFFTALFLYAYKILLQKEAFWLWLILSVAMAGLVYSKYQGGILIVLVLLSNPRLLLNYRFWLAGLFALLLLSPHIAWQLQNDFPSFKYHTTGRAKPFSLQDVLVYFPNQMASFNPFVLPLVFYVLFKFKATEAFERTLYFIILGMILFFWGTTFRGHAEPQWTIAAAIPIILILMEKRKISVSVDRYLRRFVYPSILLLLFLRIALIVDFLPIELEFHNQKKWAAKVQEYTQNRPVVFRDGYQRPSVYTFYSGIEAHTVNSRYYRQNQYDLHHHEMNFYGKPVAIITDRFDPRARAFPLLDSDSIYVHLTDKLVLTSKVIILFQVEKNTVFKQGSIIHLPISITNHYPDDLYFSDAEFPISVHAFINGKGRKISIESKMTDPVLLIPASETMESMISFVVPQELQPGTYSFALALRTGPFRDGFNSKSVKIYIE